MNQDKLNFLISIEEEAIKWLSKEDAARYRKDIARYRKKSKKESLFTKLKSRYLLNCGSW